MAIKIQFEKMHGAGNDFVLIDTRQQQFSPSKEIIQSLSNRHTGIGFDQLLLIEHSKLDQCDAAYRFFNPDGTEAEQCGNGQRCISYYLYNKSPKQKSFCISGLAGIIYSQINNNETVTINMGKIKSIESKVVCENACFQVDFGNPHLVNIVDNVDAINLEQMSRQYCKNYINGINFEAVEIIDEKTIKLRVYERGTGETLACGSGACATVAALQYAKKISDNVKVMLPGGNLVVEYNQKQKNHYLTGPAVHVFTGEFII